MPSKTINILKASLPFVPVQMQRGLSYYIKIEEFNEMVQNFQEDAKSSLSACSISSDGERSFNINEYLAAISPYLTKSEQDMIQMITNVVQALKVYNITKEFPMLMPPAKQPESDNQQTHSENSNFNIETLKNMLTPNQRAMFETYSSMLNQN